MVAPLPVLFVGSSSEQKRYLEIIESNLGDTVEVKPWTKDVFDPGLGNYLTDIINGLETSNCALFVFAPDDIRLKRKVRDYVSRDNVIFEAGLAMGILGKTRVFILAQENTTLPSDLDGLSVYRVSSVDSGVFEQSLSTELLKLRDRIKLLGLQLHKSPVRLSENVQDRIKMGVDNATTIWAVSPTLSTFLDTYEGDIERRFAEKGKPLEKLVAVLRDPWGKTLDLIYVHSGRYSEKISIQRTILASIATLQRLRSSHPDNVEIRVLDHPFICSSYVFDPEMNSCDVCVQYNPLGYVPRLPQVSAPSTSSFWNDFFVAQATEYLNKSRPYPAICIMKNLSAEIEDLDELGPLLSLWRKGYIKSGYIGDEKAIQRLGDSALVTLAKDHNRLVGFSVINSVNGKRRGTVVDQEYRGRGIASELIRLSLSKIPAQYSEVDFKSKPMQRALEQNGFRKADLQAQVKSRLGRTSLEFMVDPKTGTLLYRRPTQSNRGRHGVTDWLILYESQLLIHGNSK